MVIGYIRVSTEQQDVNNQRHEILEYAHRQGLRVDEFVEVEVSSRRDSKARRIDELILRLEDGDLLIISELSRIGRSVVEIISIINELVEKNVWLVSIKQGMEVRGPHDLQTKVMVTIFSLLAELERDMISERTKKALAAKKAQGVKLGRPTGSLGKSRLDAKIPDIIDLLQDKAPHAFIARRLKVSRTTLVNFLYSRKLVTK
jgi:DNA invertase Pin-like site-specific DNA recombinase